MKLLVIGAGLIGGSVALAARSAGWEVQISDSDKQRTQNAAAVSGLTAMQPNFVPDLVVVAVPPAQTAEVVVEQLRLFPNSTVIDVASIKYEVQSKVESIFGKTERFVPSHPMAGKEHSGMLNASYDLFADRLWVFDAATNPHRERVLALIAACGSLPIEMNTREHDETVAVTSHLPQVLSSLLAGQLLDISTKNVRVSGQGLKDMTRLASSAPELWTEILSANRERVIAALIRFEHALADFRRDLETKDQQGIAEAIRLGNQGRALLPGKHGESAKAFATVAILIDDRPGQLAAIFRTAEVANINIEDVRIDHALGREVAVIELDVEPAVRDDLAKAMSAAGWKLRQTSEVD